jgi:hypothetical protein
MQHAVISNDFRDKLRQAFLYAFALPNHAAGSIGTEKNHL